MKAHQREGHTIMASMLMVYVAILLFAMGCEQAPTASFSENTPLTETKEVIDSRQDRQIDITSADYFDPSAIWCFIFPLFCAPWDPFDPLLAWGGPNFDIKSVDVPAHARFHNACLTAWRSADFTPEGMLKIMDEEAAALGLDIMDKGETRQQARDLLEAMLNGKVSKEMIPTMEVVIHNFKQRPVPGPFPKDEPMLSLLQGLEDGISKKEAIDWQNFAQSLAGGEPREYWAASTMAASVQWWHDLSEEVGQDCSAGVAADLAAIQLTQNPHIVGIASVAGVIFDLLEFFRRRD